MRLCAKSGYVAKNSLIDISFMIKWNVFIPLGCWPWCPEYQQTDSPSSCSGEAEHTDCQSKLVYAFIMIYVRIFPLYADILLVYITQMQLLVHRTCCFICTVACGGGGQSGLCRQVWGLSLTWGTTTSHDVTAQASPGGQRYWKGVWAFYCAQK